MTVLYSCEKQIARNQAKTVCLVALLSGFSMFLFGFVGRWLGFPIQGIIVGGGVLCVMLPVQIARFRNAILTRMGGRLADIHDPREKRLVTIVEGLSGVAGLSRVPTVYIIPRDDPNAFASGLSEKSAFVGVTQGLLDTMNANELEGVMAHELSHIRHRDILLTQFVVAISASLMFLTFYLPLSMITADNRQNNKNKKDGNVLALMLLLLAPLAKLLSVLIEMGISRKREYAADANAVILCGTGEGLAGALCKIQMVEQKQSKTEKEPCDKSFRCLYFHVPAKFDGLFATHPPIGRRIQLLQHMF